MAAQLLAGSEPAMSSDMHLFSVPASFTDRYQTEHEKVGPTSTPPEDAPIQGDLNFFIAPSANGLLSLSDLFFEAEVCIKKHRPATATQPAAWINLDAADHVAPVNYLAESLFQTVQLTIANRTVSDCSPYYPYRALLEALLGYSRPAMESQLTSGAFYLDTPGLQEADILNRGETKRQSLFANSVWVQLSGKIYTDLCMQSKPLITGVPPNIRMIFNKPEFYLRQWGPSVDLHYRAFIRNPKISLRRFIGTPDYMNAVSKLLLTTTAKYHIERTIIRANDIPRGTQATTISNLQIGQLPKVVFLVLVKSSRFSGTTETNPFVFDHCNVRQLSIECDGQSYPAKPYQCDFASQQYLDCYDGLLEVLNQRNCPNGSFFLDRESYAKGYTIYAFDLTPGATGLGPLTLIKSGNLGVNISFSAPLTETYMLLTWMTFDQLVEVNNFRQVICDFAS